MRLSKSEYRGPVFSGQVLSQDQEIIKKARKYTVSGLFLYPDLLDGFSRD